MKVPVALQLWSVRDDFRRDFGGTLRVVADLGYDGVELVDWLGYGGLTARALRVLLDELNLSAAALHADLDALESDLDRLVRTCIDLGIAYLVCAWVREERRRDQEGYLAVARSLEAIGARCAEHRLRLAYHHHDFELDRFCGKPALELLLDATTPEALGLELDTYWVHRGGEDPADLLQRLGSRCPLVHLKDARADEGLEELAGPGVAHLATEIGTGVIDFGAVLAASVHTARWHVVEQDEPREHSALESARISLENLRSLAAG